MTVFKQESALLLFLDSAPKAWTNQRLALLFDNAIGQEPEPIEEDRFSLSDFRLVMRNRLLLTVSLIGILIHFVTFAVSFSFVPIYAVSVGASEFENGLIAASMFLFSYRERAREKSKHDIKPD